jgi:hypothetical protein
MDHQEKIIRNFCEKIVKLVSSNSPTSIFNSPGVKNKYLLDGPEDDIEDACKELNLSFEDIFGETVDIKLHNYIEVISTTDKSLVISVYKGEDFGGYDVEWKVRVYTFRQFFEEKKDIFKLLKGIEK